MRGRQRCKGNLRGAADNGLDGGTRFGERHMRDLNAADNLEKLA
jgi:hypothetical protein